MTRLIGCDGPCVRCCCEALAIEPGAGEAGGGVTCTAAGGFASWTDGGLTGATLTGAAGNSAGAAARGGIAASGAGTACGVVAAGVGTVNDGRGPTMGLITRRAGASGTGTGRSEEHTSELQSRRDLVCRLLL